ncbi:hypothetical protein BJX99DRAFT_268278 [Aspergillus californicus]
MDEGEILRIHSILHLVYHRNKNQHGRTKWWKWLSVLKRTVWNLALSLGSSGKADILSSTELYKQHLADRIIPRCYLAFSVVVADVQFSTLGTILFATLARLSKSTGIDKYLNLPPRVEKARDDTSTLQSRITNGKEDVGEALTRDELSESITGTATQQTPQPVLEDSKGTASSQLSIAMDRGIHELKEKKEKKKKRKKKKNAIDDLFNGLM